MEGVPTQDEREHEATAKLLDLENQSVPTRLALNELGTPIESRRPLLQRMTHYVDLAEMAVQGFDHAAQLRIIAEAEKKLSS